MFQISRHRRPQPKLHEVAPVEVAQETERQMPRRPRMSRKSDTHLSRLQRGGVLPQLFESLRRQVATFEQSQNKVFTQRKGRVGGRRGNGSRARLGGLGRLNPGQLHTLLLNFFRIHKWIAALTQASGPSATRRGPDRSLQDSI